MGHRPSAYQSRLKGDCLQPLSSLRDYFEVNLELSNPGSPVGIYQADETIVSRGHIAPPSTIHQCELKSTLVGEGSFLHVRAPCFGTSPKAVGSRVASAHSSEGRESLAHV